MEKLQQFLVEEQEVLADFLLDMESTEDNKENNYSSLKVCDKMSPPYLIHI